MDKRKYFADEADLDVFVESLKTAKQVGCEKRFLDAFFFVYAPSEVGNITAVCYDILLQLKILK